MKFLLAPFKDMAQFVLLLMCYLPFSIISITHFGMWSIENIVGSIIWLVVFNLVLGRYKEKVQLDWLAHMHVVFRHRATQPDVTEEEKKIVDDFFKLWNRMMTNDGFRPNRFDK